MRGAWRGVLGGLDGRLVAVLGGALLLLAGSPARAARVCALGRLAIVESQETTAPGRLR